VVAAEAPENGAPADDGQEQIPPPVYGNEPE
jgi:hypothetical protein